MRVPVVPPTGDCKPFQEVLIELAGRLRFPLFVNADGSRKYRDYPDFVIRYETAPGSGIGFLAGWRGKDGEKSLRGEPNPRQWEMYAKNNCVFQYHLPRNLQYMRNWNRDYLQWAQQMGLRRDFDPIVIHIYSEFLQKFRLAAQGKRPGKQPPDRLRARVDTHFDPLPFWSEPLEAAHADAQTYPLRAVTQRPMAMYHSWDSQNAWLRQIHTHNYLMVNPRTRAGRRHRRRRLAVGRVALGQGARHVPATPKRWSRARCGPGTRSARPAAPGISRRTPTSRARASCSTTSSREELPARESGSRMSNSDPITGQAAWYDLRVRIYPADAGRAGRELAAVRAAPRPRRARRPDVRASSPILPGGSAS